MARRKRALQERLWAKIEKTDTCWFWRGSINNFGYGLERDETGKTVQVHRLIYRLLVGDPDGWCVLHSCDNPACVNPDHLRLGTQKDNMADCVARGRRGPVGRKWLKSEVVLEIRHRHKQGETLSQLSGIFGLTRGSIAYIVSGRAYANVTEAQA